MTPKRFAFFVFSPLLAGLLAACGGDKAPEAKSPPTVPPSAAAAGASAASRPLLLDLTTSAQKVRDLKSFRFDLAMTMDLGQPAAGSSDLGSAFAAAFLGALGDIRAKGSYVAPDQSEVTMSFAGQEIGYVQIGGRAWVKTGASWRATSPDPSLGLTPTDFFDDLLPGEVLRAAKTSRETVNGVSATRYSFDKAALEKLASQLGGPSDDLADITEVAFDVWVSDGDIPVKLLMALSGKDESGQKVSVKIEINIRNINDPSITVKAPL